MRSKNSKMKKILVSLAFASAFCRPACAQQPQAPAVREINVSSEASKISVTDLDISIVKIREEMNGIKNSVEEIRGAASKSGENSIALNEKVNGLERRVARLEESVSTLTENIAEVESLKAKISASDISHRQEISEVSDRLKKDIKSNEDETEIILNDLDRLKEDLAAGRRPSLDSGKQIKEYIPYISLGVSVISFFIAIH